MNPLMAKLKKAGHKFAKKNWPTISRNQIKDLGIADEEIWQNTHPATLSETMGPNWKFGFMFETCKNFTRPLSFNE